MAEIILIFFFNCLQWDQCVIWTSLIDVLTSQGVIQRHVLLLPIVHAMYYDFPLIHLILSVVIEWELAVIILV